MSELFNIYCDESCHLENDNSNVMVLGAIWCRTDIVQDIHSGINRIKQSHNIPKSLEVKWKKVSPAKIDFYEELVEYFFNNEELHFRTLIIPDKKKLNHNAFDQTHDDWYYKMYFDLLKVIFLPSGAKYNIYLDIKDSFSVIKSNKLHEILCNNMYDFSKDIINRVQIIRSHEVLLLQLADLLIGAIGYLNRGLSTSKAKTKLVEIIKRKSGYGLNRTTLLREQKFNIFRWKAKDI